MKAKERVTTEVVVPFLEMEITLSFGALKMILRHNNACFTAQAVEKQMNGNGIE